MIILIFIELMMTYKKNKIENELEKKEEDDVRIKEKIEENQEEEEIQRKIVEYNRKGGSLLVCKRSEEQRIKEFSAG